MLDLIIYHGLDRGSALIGCLIVAMSRIVGLNLALHTDMIVMQHGITLVQMHHCTTPVYKAGLFTA